MNAALSPDFDSFIEGALTRLPAASRDRALEIGTGFVSAVLGTRFQSIQMAQPGALADLPVAEFNFILAYRTLGETSYGPSVVSCFREVSRLLQEQGIFGACLNNLSNSATALPIGELVELARELDFQILLIEGVRSQRMSILCRKRAPGWRLNLSDYAALASVRVTEIVNAWDRQPVVASRGRYSSIAIGVKGLPIDVDLLDLEILTGGVRATAVSISEPDARGHQQIRAILPSLEQTGLIPLELRWFGEPLTSEPTYIRVIPPGPIVPRITRVSAGATRLAGITILIEELTRPDELSVTIDGVGVWGLEALCVDPQTQSYEVRSQIPDEVDAGVHELRLTAGRRKLPPVSIEIP